MQTRQLEYLWKDRKRFMGMPLSFTRYKLTEDRLFVETGFFSTKYEEIVLYRIKDISLKRTLWQKICGVGTITVQSSDKTTPLLVIKNVKKSFAVKELLHESVEQQKLARRYRISEVIGDDGDDDDDFDDED